MEDEMEDFGGTIFEGAAGYDEGFGDDQSAPDQDIPAPQQPPPVEVPPAVSTPPSATPAQPAPSSYNYWDTMSTVFRVGGGAALGYFAADREEDRAKYAGIGAAAGYLGVFGVLAFAWYMSREKGR